MTGAQQPAAADRKWRKTSSDATVRTQEGTLRIRKGYGLHIIFGE